MLASQITRNVEILRDWVTSWIEIQDEICLRKSTRISLIRKLRTMCVRLSSLFDFFALNMDHCESRDKDISSATRTPACKNCEDKFICLTQTLDLIRQCPRCREKILYAADTNGTFGTFELLLHHFHGGLVSSSATSLIFEGSDKDLCPLAVHSRVCRRCGYIEENHDRAVRWLNKQLKDADAITTIHDHLRHSGVRAKGSASLSGTRFSSTIFAFRKLSVSSLNTDVLVSLMRQAKKQEIISFWDMLNLLEPNPVPCTGRDPRFLVDFEKMDTNTLHYFSLVLNAAPQSMEEAMTIRNEMDICVMAREHLNRRGLPEGFIPIPFDL